jgi:hypothetical protein
MMGLLDLIRGTSISANNRPATAIVATDASNSLQTVAKIAVAQASAPEIHSRDLLPDGAVTQECDLNPDRYCWPHSVAMNSREIDLFLVRLEAFVARGLNESKAEELADRLVRRDRESDDRCTCFECSHLKGFNHLGCDNWKVARISSTEEGALRNKDDCMILQRCDGFSAVVEASRG